MIWALLLTPAIAGLMAMVLRPNWPRRTLLLLAAAAHSGLVAACWVEQPAPVVDGWMAIDAAGLLFLSITSALFLAAAIYAVGYLARESHPARRIDRTTTRSCPSSIFPKPSSPDVCCYFWPP